MNREKAKLMQAEVCAAAKKIYTSGLVAGTWGNISARIDEDYMVITPSGMDYDRLYPEQMVIANIHTLEYEGDLKPSIETVVHAAIYKDRPEVNGVVHTHSNYALVMATARKEIPMQAAICSVSLLLMKNHLYTTYGIEVMVIR